MGQSQSVSSTVYLAVVPRIQAPGYLYLSTLLLITSALAIFVSSFSFTQHTNLHTKLFVLILFCLKSLLPNLCMIVSFSIQMSSSQKDLQCFAG